MRDLLVAAETKKSPAANVNSSGLRNDIRVKSPGFTQLVRRTRRPESFQLPERTSFTASE